MGFFMNISPIKSTSIALFTLIFSNQVYAMHENQDEPRAVNVSPRTKGEKYAFRVAIDEAVRARNVQQVNDALNEYEPKDWFSQRALDWMFKKSAAAEGCDPVVEYLLARTNRFQLSQTCLTEVFTSRPSDEVKLSILNLVAQQDVRHPLLTQVNLEDALPKAAARGRLALVQRIINLPPDSFTLNDDCRLSTMQSAAGWGKLAIVEFLLQHTRDHGLLTKRHLNEMLNSTCDGYRLILHSQDELMNLRNVVDSLLNMDEEGPDQITVDTLFGDTVTYYPEVNLVRAMVLNSKNELRTGLRPSNKSINSVKGSCYDTETSVFLNSLVLPSPQQPAEAPAPKAPAPSPVPQPPAPKAAVAPKAPAKKGAVVAPKAPAKKGAVKGPVKAPKAVAKKGALKKVAAKRAVKK